MGIPWLGLGLGLGIYLGQGRLGQSLAAVDSATVHGERRGVGLQLPSLVRVGARVRGRARAKARARARAGLGLGLG